MVPIYQCILLIAREHGLETLKTLLETKQFKILIIFTHKLNPKSHDPQRNQRSDYKEFVTLSKSNNIQLISIDDKSEQEKLENFCKNTEYDFLISVSWRYHISSNIFKKAKIGAINLHRGDLPKYAGVEPIRRSLENKEREIAVCSHLITENYDEGKVLCKVKHPVNYNEKKTLLENVERLKKEITPYFPQLTIKSLETLIKI